MSAEQVAGILRQCSQQVRLVVARSVREPNATTTVSDTNTPASLSPYLSMPLENTGKNTNGISASTTLPSSSTIAANDGIITSSENKILLRTERLLGNNQNFEKILENLREQVDYFLSIDIAQQEGEKTESD